MTGFVADVGGTNTRLARVGPEGVIASSVEKRPNDDFQSFEAIARDYLEGQARPTRVVVAVAGPVAGTRAELTNRNWSFDTGLLSDQLGGAPVHLVNDLEALGHAVSSVPADAIEALHTGAEHGAQGQALVVGLGTGFNVSPVDTRSGAVFSVEQGHASLPSSVMQYLATRLPDVSPFDSIENLFSGVGMLRLARVLGLQVESAAEIAQSGDPKAHEAIDICTEALGRLVHELAYTYYPRAGFYFNGSLAKLLLSPERRERVLAPLRGDDSFDGQFCRLPAFLFVSDTVALGGCASRLMALDCQQI